MDGERKFEGIGVSPGIAIARAHLYRSEALAPPLRMITHEEAESEWERFMEAKAVARRQLRDMGDNLGLEAAKGESGIIEAHMMVLDDEVFEEDVRREIFGNLHNSEWALHDVSAVYIARLKALDDEVLCERASDIADVSRRILKALMGGKGDRVFKVGEPCVVVADALTPSETLSLPRDKVLGVVLARGAITSHAALLVRAIGIPAVFGAGGITDAVADGDVIAIDGNKGLAVVNPCEDDESIFRGRAAERESFIAKIGRKASAPAETPDGFTVHCLANIENDGVLGSVTANGGEGVGLFRTEYLWLAEGRPVDEETQTAAYAKVAKETPGVPTIRTFDLGGDKFVGTAREAPREANPFLGLRSIRFLLKNEQMCKMQLRAILSASAIAKKRIDILLPMVSDLHELVRTRKLLEECVSELMERGIEPVHPKLGIMIEVPSAALVSGTLARHADFFSVGTNDLTQYTLAVDRGNESAAHLYQPLHPSVLKLIAMTAQAARRAGIGITVCGEMAGNPIQALTLLGLRIDTLSMAPSAIPLVKETIRRIPLAEAEAMAASALDSATAAQVRHLARDLMARFAPEILRQC